MQVVDTWQFDEWSGWSGAGPFNLCFCLSIEVGGYLMVLDFEWILGFDGQSEESVVLGLKIVITKLADEVFSFRANVQRVIDLLNFVVHPFLRVTMPISHKLAQLQ